MDEWTRIPMQLIQIEARQTPGYPHEKRYAGACIDCYIKDQTATNALHIAKGWIADNGWDVVAVEEQREIAEEDYAEDSEGREYVRQALTDEEVFVYYVYERDDDSEETPADATQNA
jgi:hypothetical protein